MAIRLLFALLIITTFLAGLGLPAAPATAGVLSPLSGSGDFAFSADLPVFPGAAGPRLDLAVQVYNPEIHFESGEPAVAIVQMSVKIARQGVVAFDESDVYELRVPHDQALSRLHYQLLERSIPIEPGRWAITIGVRDLGAERARNIGFAELDPIEAEATGVLEVAEPPAQGPRWSDPEFRTLAGLPNPERLFGVNQDTLLAYVELADAVVGEAYTIALEVADPIGGGLEKETILITPDRERAAALYRLPLGTFPEGTYQIRWTPGWNDSEQRETEFSVSWRMDRVVQSARDLWVEAILMLPGEEIETFRRLSRPAQLDMMDRFWASVDPTPDTPKNEVYERFQKRVEYTSRQFGRYGKPGPLTDRGRIYVRYGEPALVSVEVVPLNADQLDEAIERVHDAYQMEQPSQFNKESVIRQPLRLLEQSANEDESADRRRNMVGAGREGAFELWQYNLQGDPLVPETLTWSEDMGLSFLFVDRLGSGDYKLEYTNVPLRY